VEAVVKIELIVAKPKLVQARFISVKAPAVLSEFFIPTL